MALKSWKAYCKECGRRGQGGISKQGTAPPTQTPNVPGKCPATKNGKHVAIWIPA